MAELRAEIISVLPNKVKIAVDNFDDFNKIENKLKVGSYLKVSDDDNIELITIIESYNIELIEKAGKPERRYIIESSPLGILNDGVFERGCDTIAIPPKHVVPATDEDIRNIYDSMVSENERFIFSKLATNEAINVPVNGNKFFNKHIAIVGSTGSGKSHTVAKVIQEAVDSKVGNFNKNNSHIIIFDIHDEYKSAFPNANCINIDTLKLPYWLLNGDELEDLFMDTDANDHNQRNVFREFILENKIESNTDISKLSFGSPVKFDIVAVLEKIKEKDAELIPGSGSRPKNGPLNGKLSNFVSRLENKINDTRLNFLLSDESKNSTYIDTIKLLTGYNVNSNVNIIDLSGVPFEVLSITVSLISRLIFEFGFYNKKLINNNPDIKEIPILLVYEEAHKYVPKSELAKYRTSKISIERIAKEGRKYGVSLLLASQRPSEISETIFSQCSNFIALRLTNPNDQNYVKKTLPDSLGNLIDKISSLSAGEGIIIGDALPLPTIVKIDTCSPQPSSNDVMFYDIWRREWHEKNFADIEEKLLN